LELEELLDQDGDGLGAACKTDGERGLGCLFNSLWKSHHAVNQQLHHVQNHAGRWLHPHVKEKHVKKQEDCSHPSSCMSLPKTLMDEMEELRDL
jgi:hypothetical protein